MMISSNGRAFIKKWEGLRLRAYVCAGGWLTIGYGHAIAPQSARAASRARVDGITLDVAERYFDSDIATVEAAMKRLIKRRMAQPQIDALASFTFNLGAGALQRSTLRRRINRGEHPTRIAAEFSRWIMAGGRPVRGLILRRKAESNLYLSSTPMSSAPLRPEHTSRIPPPLLPTPKPRLRQSFWRKVRDAILGGL